MNTNTTRKYEVTKTFMSGMLKGLTITEQTEYLATTDDGAVFCPLVGYRVLRQGRYGKWNKAGLYCSQEAAQHFIEKYTNGPADKYRVLEEAVIRPEPSTTRPPRNPGVVRMRQSR